MTNRFFLILFLLLLCQSHFAQLKITCNNKEINYRNDSILYVFSKDTGFTFSGFKHIQKEQWLQLKHNAITVSGIKETVWLKIPLRSILKYGNFNLLHIPNPHINFLYCGIIEKDSLIKEFSLTGDNLLFSTRSLPFTSFVFPLDSVDLTKASVILAADKRYSRLTLPVDFTTTLGFSAQSQQDWLITGLLLGIFLFLLFFNFYLFVTLQQKIFLWYCIYLLLINLYAASDQGLLFKYFYPYSPALNDLIRPAAFSLSIIPILIFYADLLSVCQTANFIFKLFRSIVIGFLLIFVVAFSMHLSGNFALQGFWLSVYSILSPAILITALISSFYCLLKKIRYSLFAAIAFSGVNIFMIMYSLAQNNMLPSNIFFNNTQYWGILFESLLMILALVWRFRWYKIQAEQLTAEKAQQQEYFFTEMALWQEKELRRLSHFLHDTIATSVGLLRMETDYMELTEENRKSLSEKIQVLGNDVRSVSHSFSSSLLEEKGLKKIVEEHVALINNYKNISLQFEWIGNYSGIRFQYQLVIYRIIQELLQNLVKHSRAKNASLQLITEDNLISIYIEDDGTGPDQTGALATPGIGLSNIKSLIEVLHGRFFIDNTNDNGFSVSIEFTQPS